MTYSFGIIGGTGKQGSALATRLLRHNYPVRIGSRSETRGQKKADELNESFSTSLATGGDNAFAVKADVIVLALPFDQVDELLLPLKTDLAGKIIVDMTVNLTFGKYIKTNLYEDKSSYENIRDMFPDSEVVACLKTISNVLLGREEQLDQTDFQMTTSDEAFELTASLVKQFGLQPVRVRGKTHAHTIERMVALSIQLNKEYQGSHVGFKLTNLNM